MSDDIYSKTMSPKIESPLVQVYTGNGKGKTTAALGLAFRAAGHGFRVKILQFMKDLFEKRDPAIEPYLRNMTVAERKPVPREAVPLA